jgi:acylphosphatase
MGVVARHASISGKVQGVFYRSWLQGEADKLSVKGWVRNCPDGHVEAHLEGEAPPVAQIVEMLREGPPAANVEDVRLWNVEPCDFDGFEVRH